MVMISENINQLNMILLSIELSMYTFPVFDLWDAIILDFFFINIQNHDYKCSLNIFTNEKHH